MLRVGHVLKDGRIYGPGTRFTIWLQGCNLGCKGCWNQQFWPSEGGESMSVTELVDQIAAADVQGITLLGGEPLQQVEGVFELIQQVKGIGKTVFLYTGYEKKEFTPMMQACVDLCDILIAGRYVESKRNTHLRWRGSTNQIIEFPTGHYSETELNEVREVEVHIQNGNAFVYGYPTEEEKNFAGG